MCYKISNVIVSSSCNSNGRSYQYARTRFGINRIVFHQNLMVSSLYAKRCAVKTLTAITSLQPLFSEIQLLKDALGQHMLSMRLNDKGVIHVLKPDSDAMISKNSIKIFVIIRHETESTLWSNIFLLKPSDRLLFYFDSTVVG